MNPNISIESLLDSIRYNNTSIFLRWYHELLPQLYPRLYAHIEHDPLTLAVIRRLASGTNSESKHSVHYFQIKISGDARNRRKIAKILSAPAFCVSRKFRNRRLLIALVPNYFLATTNLLPILNDRDISVPPF